MFNLFQRRDFLYAEVGSWRCGKVAVITLANDRFLLQAANILPDVPLEQVRTVDLDLHPRDQVP
jgi:hypothetical protein